MQRIRAGTPSRARAANLRLVAPERRTKIVATLGPASDSPEQLRALVAAGMDAARLNLSHGTHADHAERARRVREVEVGSRPADRADRRPPGAEAPDRRARRADRCSRAARQITICAEELATDGELPIAPAVIGDVLKAGTTC